MKLMLMLTQLFLLLLLDVKGIQPVKHGVTLIVTQSVFVNLSVYTVVWSKTY